MGEIADDIIDGACCELCGQYFEEENGFPAVCEECWNTVLNKEDRKHHQKSLYPTL